MEIVGRVRTGAGLKGDPWALRGEEDLSADTDGEGFDARPEAIATDV